MTFDYKTMLARYIDMIGEAEGTYARGFGQAILAKTK